MFAPGTHVKLIAAIGDHRAGTEAVVMGSRGGVCEIMLGDKQLTISCSALTAVGLPAGRQTPDFAAHSSRKNGA